jgi:hypothetical protein
MSSLLGTILFMVLIVTFPFLLGFWAGKLYYGLKNER